jgi:excisionase family DNA binding protein
VSPFAKLAFSIDDLAERAGVGRTFIYEEINAGRLIVTKAGRRSLVRAEDAKAWLDALPKLAPKPEGER